MNPSGYSTSSIRRASRTLIRRASRTLIKRDVNPRSAPITDLNIETTTYCNRRCSYCPNSIFERSLKKNAREMSFSLFKKIVDDLAEMGFTGRISPQLYGEPLTDSRLVSRMEYANTTLPRAKLLIVTNGDFLTPTLLNQLRDVGVHDYFITIHDSDPRARKQSIERIKQLKKGAKRDKKDVTLEYQTVINPSNRGGLIEITRRTPPPRCLDLDNALPINYRGDVLVCCNDYLGEVTFGNVQHESLKDVWTKPEFVKLREMLTKKVYSLDICKRCTGTLSLHDPLVALRKRQ
jgi:cyclic pyranopterin phosphate synthase